MKGVTTASYGSGYLLFMREQTLLAQPFDAKRMELSGEATPIAEHVAVNGATAVPEFSTSENGILVYQTGEANGAWDLLWFGRDGKPGGAVAQQDRWYYPALSPEGDRLAVSLFNGTSGIADLWVLDLKRGTKSRLTFGPGTQLSAVWARDGKTLYYASNAKSLMHIYSKPSDGSGAEQAVLENPDSADVPFCASWDGQYLIYSHRKIPSTNLDLWVLPLKGGGKPFPIVQTPFNDAIRRFPRPENGWRMRIANRDATKCISPHFPAAAPDGRYRIAGVWIRCGAAMGKKCIPRPLRQSDGGGRRQFRRGAAAGNTARAVSSHGSATPVGKFFMTADGKKFLINSGSVKGGTSPSRW